MRKFLFFLFLLLTACLSPPGGTPGPAPRPHPWAEALRALDPADALAPANDITAIYLRQNGDTLQIRVDLLDFDRAGELSLDIKIGDASTTTATPLLLHIPSASDSPRITLDPLLATVIADIPLSAISSHSLVDVSTPEDKITGLTLDGPAPTDVVPLLLTFYDTFAARFPAEALRSWDGAHTGPRGERHGLKHLLDAVEEYQIPVVLLDLKEAGNLSALDAMGVLPRIQALADQGLILLPDTSYDIRDNELFGFSASPYLYVPYSRPWSQYDYRFVFTADSTHLYHWTKFPTDNITYIPVVAGDDTTQPESEGPSLEIRRALLDTALNEDKIDILVLGGSLVSSTWGNPDMVNSTMAYFASRPYIKLISEKQLLNFSTIHDQPILVQRQSDQTFVKMENFYETANGRVMDYADFWAEHLPEQYQIRCDLDSDWDDQDECILANKDFLAILDPQGARLTYLFAVGRIGNPPYTQLIGPSWQVAVGLSNRSLWDPLAGEAADPGAYPGAFADSDDPFKVYEPAIAGNTLVFTALDGTRTKTFTLTEASIEVEYRTREPVRIQISLLVDPDTRFTPDWAKKYTKQNIPGGVTWGLENGPMVRIQTEGSVTMQAFNESLTLLANPEDPDLAYPPGHYIPFPMAIVETTMEDNHFLQILLRAYP